jgi:quercetin dioxygenase-like cupin family protein
VADGGDAGGQHRPGRPYDTDQQLSVGPSASGTVFRTLELPPDADWRFDAEGNEIKPLAYHTTRSIDYAIVLSGSVWAILDEAEVEMHAGDVMVQRGTAHAWSNRSDTSCVLAFVLIGGNLPDGS